MSGAGAGGYPVGIYNWCVAGWWATGNEVTNHSSVIHEYYSRECRAPVHVTLDTGLGGARMGLRAYLCAALGVPRGKQGCMFTPIPVALVCYEPEVPILVPTPTREYLHLFNELVYYLFRWVLFQVVGLQLCQKTMGVGGAGARPRQVQPMQDLAQIADASTKLSTLLEQVAT